MKKLCSGILLVIMSVMLCSCSVGEKAAVDKLLEEKAWVYVDSSANDEVVYAVRYTFKNGKFEQAIYLNNFGDYTRQKHSGVYEIDTESHYVICTFDKSGGETEFFYMYESEDNELTMLGLVAMDDRYEALFD